jgi:hypothetical protein
MPHSIFSVRLPLHLLCCALLAGCSRKRATISERELFEKFAAQNSIEFLHASGIGAPKD